MKELLKLDSVSLRFGGLTALSSVSWSIPQPPSASENPSRIHGMIGPNGAGKSTLFNLITGIYKPTAGKIYFLGNEIQKVKTTDIVRLGIARTFQNIRLLPQLSVLDNLRVVTAVEREGTFWKSLLGLKGESSRNAEILYRARNLLSMVGLSSVETHLPLSLPYGDQRKLEIARALMRKPKLLLLDEPAAGMNATEKQNLNGVLKKIALDQITVLVIEHDMKFIMSLCQHITVLNQGAICAEGTPDQIQNDPHVIETYLGKQVIQV